METDGVSHCKMNNNLKCTAIATLDLLKEINFDILQWPGVSADLNEQQLNKAAVKVWQSISNEETQCLCMCDGLQPVTDCK